MKKCDGCGSLNTGVVDSREEAYAYVRRRRKCNNCGSRWTTYEVTEEVYMTLRNFSKALSKIEQARREIASAEDAIRETLPPGVHLQVLESGAVQLFGGTRTA